MTTFLCPLLGDGVIVMLERYYALPSTADRIRALWLGPAIERYAMKARMMEQELPVQIIRESTLRISSQVRNGQPGTNPLSDRLWNFGTAIFYKCGAKPWKTPWAREGVCYVGLAYKRAEDNSTACCAAQMFLDSGDGVVFVGDFTGQQFSSGCRAHRLRSVAIVH